MWWGRGLIKGGTTVLIQTCIYSLYQCGYNSYLPSFVFSEQTLRFEVSVSYLFCWFWWIRRPLLLKLSFHNEVKIRTQVWIFTKINIFGSFEKCKFLSHCLNINNVSVNNLIFQNVQTTFPVITSDFPITEYLCFDT